MKNPTTKIPRNSWRTIEPAYKRLLTIAKGAGFLGFGGDCGQAAIAINEVVLRQNGSLIGAFNEYFHNEFGLHFGHVVVQVCENGPYLDADGEFKGFDDIECWGMLDPNDSTYTEIIEDADRQATEDNYQNVQLYLFDSAKDLQTQVPYDYDNVPHFVRLLEDALSTLSKKDQNRIAQLRAYATPLIAHEAELPHESRLV